MAESKRRSNKSSSRRSSSKSTGGSSSKSRGSSSTKSKQRSSGSSRSNNSRDDRSPREIVMGAIQQVQELIGRPIEGVTGMEKDGSEWRVTLEVVELERIPNTTDVLGQYEVTLDKDGEVTGAHRTRRYHRAEAGEG
jgi:hypothetical protein